MVIFIKYLGPSSSDIDPELLYVITVLKDPLFLYARLFVTKIPK